MKKVSIAATKQVQSFSWQSRRTTTWLRRKFNTINAIPCFAHEGPSARPHLLARGQLGPDALRLRTSEHRDVHADFFGSYC